MRNPFVVLHADFPDNPLRKDIGIQGMETENVLGADLSTGAARPLSSRTSLLLVAQAVGCGPALRASSSSWSIALASLQEETGL